MKNGFHVIIPARHNSSRLSGKLLLEIGDKTVIERVYLQALKAEPQSVSIATDHEAIATLAKSFGAHVIMTQSTHQSGTDRVAEAAAQAQWTNNEIIVNVQGDEPFIDPALIRQVADSLDSSMDISMATLCWPIEDELGCHNPNIVKVVRDVHLHALYFSRSLIPFNRDNPQDSSGVFKHIGLYAYRASFLQYIVSQPVCELEKQEALEQLRVLWLGYKIKVETASLAPLQDINTAEDLLRARAFIAGH